MNNYNQKNIKNGLKSIFNTKITIKSYEDLSFSFGNEIPYPKWHWITQSEWDLKTIPAKNIKKDIKEVEDNTRDR